MNEADFSDPSTGVLVPSLGAKAFVPSPLPRQVVLSGSTARLLSQANHCIGELSGISRPLKNPYLLGSALLRREAILSSRIEGTVTNSEQLVLFEAGAQSADDENVDTREVSNYARAMRRGIALLPKLPVSLRLIKELHSVLLEGVRGERERPGRFREDQNWIGRPGSSIHEARYVPPPPQQMQDGLEELERYLHLEPHVGADAWQTLEEDADLAPLLVRIALIHYQFEAIHPFRDGNGRVGRLLIPLLLVSHGRLRAPLLYVSSYLERHRTEYYDHMLAVSQRGAWTEWIDFFMRAVVESSTEAIGQADELIRMREVWRARFDKARSSALLHKLIDSLFERPGLRISDAEQILGVTPASASANIKKLVAEGILEERTGRKRDQVFVAMDIIRLMDQVKDA